MRRLTTIALASAAFFGMAVMANAQVQNGKHVGEDSSTGPHSSGPPNAAMPQRQNRNMGTTGQGSPATRPVNPKNDAHEGSPPGRPNDEKHTPPQ
jgi:hypothetical protein